MRRRMPPAPLVLAVLAVLAATALAGCGAGPPADVVVTVTAVPSAGGGPPSGAATVAPSPAGPSASSVAEPESEVVGRAFDFGLVVGARRAGGTDVLVVDRWTDPDVEDDRVAREGLPVAPWDVGSDRYVNQNTEVTFDVPVREGATFLLHHCLSRSEPLQTRSVDASELAGTPEEDRLVLLRLDDAGWATGGETFAGC